MKEGSPPRTAGWFRKTGESKNSAKCLVPSAFRAGAILLHIMQRRAGNASFGKLRAGNAEEYLRLGE